jgi:hypothetical protein
MRFGTWNVRNLCRAGPLKTVARESGKYNLDLVGVQIRWEKAGAQKGQRIIRFLMEKEMTIIS